MPQDKNVMGQRNFPSKYKSYAEYAKAEGAPESHRMENQPDYTAPVDATKMYKKPDSTPTMMRGVKGYKKGGMVKKTGLALLHKGEKVLTKSQSKKTRMR